MICLILCGAVWCGVLGDEVVWFCLFMMEAGAGAGWCVLPYFSFCFAGSLVLSVRGNDLQQV